MSTTLSTEAIRAQQAGADDAPARFATARGRTVDFEALKDHRLVLFFFSIRMQNVADVLRAYQQLYTEREAVHLQVVGISIDAGRERQVAALLEREHVDFPVIVDADGRFRRVYQPQSYPAAYFFAQGWYPLGTLPGYPTTAQDPVAFYTNLLRKRIGLDEKLRDDPLRQARPELPDFTCTDVTGRPYSKTDLRGRPFLVSFVDTRCPHCSEELEFFKELYAELAPAGLEILTIVVTRDADVRAFQRERQLPFPVIPDPEGTLRWTLGYRGAVPDNLVVDAEGRIRYRHTSFGPEDPDLYRMELRRLLGLDNEPLLLPSGPSGVRRCLICHEREYFQWTLTGHAHAMRTLQASGDDTNPDCVKCHVVGWDAPGGFNADDGARARLLKDVQCEACHGDGGPHVGEATLITAATCQRCHDEEHSLHFDFAKARPLVEHDLEDFEGDPAALERAAQAREALKKSLFELPGSYLGAKACKECHPGPYARWLEDPHRHAYETLAAAEEPGASRDPACLACHTTGFGRPWKSAAAGAGAAAGVPRVARGVQCEACHGPGERHVAATDPETRRTSILGLGKKCAECVIRQRCTSCHDRQNDPDFDLDTALPPVRHRCRPESAGEGDGAAGDSSQ